MTKPTAGARVHRAASVDAVRQRAGVGEQSPATCEHGTEGCPGPNSDSPRLPCARCFFNGGRDD